MSAIIIQAADRFQRRHDLVGIEPLSAVDLAKLVTKLKADNAYKALRSVVSANEYLNLVYPFTTAGKKEKSTKFNPDF